MAAQPSQPTTGKNSSGPRMDGRRVPGGRSGLTSLHGRSWETTWRGGGKSGVKPARPRVSAPHRSGRVADVALFRYTFTAQPHSSVRIERQPSKLTVGGSSPSGAARRE